MTEIEKFELRLRMDATVSVYDSMGNATDWLKPGSETATTWKGMPVNEEIILRFRAMSDITSGTLEDVILAVRNRLDEARRTK